jgi:hypothetical protein
MIMNAEIQVAREIAADHSGYVEHARSVFRSGWDAAIQYIESLTQTPGGDGCYCVHHPDDPAHTKDCYDLVKALTRG